MLRLLFVLFGLFMPLTLVADCPIPKPFKLLSTTEAKSYVAEEIIKKTKAMSGGYIQHSAETATVELINFWASWCAPCREELPLLDELAKTTKASIKLVNIGDSQAVIDEVLTALAIQQLTNYRADGQLLSALSLAGLPATLVWSKKHKAVFLAMGKLNKAKLLSQWLGCL